MLHAALRSKLHAVPDALAPIAVAALLTLLVLMLARAEASSATGGRSDPPPDRPAQHVTQPWV